MRTKTRKLGIVTPDAPVNVKSAEELARIVRKCGRNGAQISTYAADTAAGEQSIASTARFKNDGVTTVMFFSDPIGPVFATGAATAASSTYRVHHGGQRAGGLRPAGPAVRRQAMGKRLSAERLGPSSRRSNRATR